MQEAGLEEMETYIYRRHNTVAHFITTTHIIDLFLETERRPGAQVENCWLEKEGIDLVNVQGEASAGRPEESEGSETYLTV